MATKLCCCIPFPWSSSSDDEDGRDPASAESVSFSQTVPGATRCEGAPFSGSSNVPLKSEGEDVDANLNVSGGPRDEAPVSGSSNVPLEGQNVRVNFNVSGASKCDEVPSSSPIVSTNSVIKSILHEDIVAVEGENVNVNLDDLMEHISELLKRREEKKRLPLETSTSRKWTFPSGSDLKNLTEIMSSGIEFLSDWKSYISGPVKAILKGIGKASVATAGLLVVAYTLERFDDLSTNKEECLDLLKEMVYVANLVKIFKQSPKGSHGVIEDAKELIVEGAVMCCVQMDTSRWKSFLLTSKNKDELSDIREKLNLIYKKINIEIGLRVSSDIERVLTAIEPKRNSPLSKEYPEHAVGIEKSIKDVMKLLECESEQKAVTVILHGFGGMGKTTLADAVFSQVKGGKCSEVKLFNATGSKPDIIQLQKKMLEHLMEPGELIPDIPKPEDGRRALGKRLKEVEAFIYIDNVLDRVELESLLPEDLDKAKKVRLLLTARDKNVKLAMPGSTPTEIYPMEGIKNPKAALSILRKDILEGIDSSQFDEIIKTCHGIPLMLKLVARFIAHAVDKGAAYSELMQAEEKWNNEGFNQMRYAFAYDALHEKCKDPFLDICSYFKRWDWDTVGNIVGKNELEMLESRALVTKDTFTGVVNVHDVILELGTQMSEKVRMTFTRASELKEFLKDQEEDSKPIKGIWLSDNKDALKISAATLDLMHKSLRVLQLGNLTKVEGNCIKKFKKLIFFKAKITQLPFDVSKSNQLGYLNYEPSDLKLSKMPSSLRHMEFDGSSHSHAFQIFSTDLERLGNLRILRLVNFLKLTNLPEGLGNQLSGLQELSLSDCHSIEKLPDSISKLRSLRILKMDSCSSLTELPVNFGSLSSLQELNLDGCSQLKALPDSVQKLSSLTLLNLSNCKKLLNLPLGLGNLTGLVELYLNTCKDLKSIPESIGELKLLRTLGVSKCWGLKELAHGFCNLSLITHLSLAGCISLKELPDRFGQLASLKLLDFESCYNLKKLPEGFGQLKKLEVLVLKECGNFEKLPEDFRCLTSLQHLDLSFCCKLEGKSMDYMVKMERLQLVHIEESEQLVKRWEEIHGDGLWSFAVISGQKLSLLENQKKNIENNLLSELDRVLTNGRRDPFHVSDLPLNTLIIVICDLYPDKNAFPWALIEETIDEMKIKFEIIYIGPEFDKLPTKVKDSIFVVHLPEIRANDMLEKVCLTLDAALPEERGAWYLQMHTKMVGNGKSDKYRPCWSFLTARELEEFVLGNCKRYLRLMQLVERDRQSNIELLRELFAPEGDETTPVLLKNESSQQNRTENFELKTNCGVDKLEGKTILLEMRPTHLCYDIRLQSLKEMYIDEKEKLNLEIISIPLVRPSQPSQPSQVYNQFSRTSRTSSQVSDVFDVYKQFSREVPWFVLQNSWMVITRVVKFFLAKHCGWKEGDECEKWCPMINWIIEPNGRISIYRPSISLKDRAEVFKVLFKHLERESFQVRWGVKPCPIMHDKIEELKKEEWEHLKNMSTLNLIFNHLESISDQVKKLMFHGRLIWLYSGRGDKDISSIQNAVEQLTDNIHIIHVGDIDRKCFHLTDCIYKEYYYPLKNTTEIEGMSLLNLSEHEIMTFSFRLHYLKKEINRMELCEPKGLLKGLLHYFQEKNYKDGFKPFMDYGSMTLMDEGGKVFAALLLQHDKKDRAQRLIKSMVKDFEEGKERHDQNMQTVSAAVEQENVDVYFDSLRENISEFWEVEFYRKLLKFNKEGKKWSQPKVTWPTSKSFCILKAFMSEGTNADWVKDLISRQPEEHEQDFRSYHKLKFVIKSLLNDIEEENWAVAVLLAVADVLERFETVSANRIDCLLLLEEMFRLAQYTIQVKLGLWRTKTSAIALILANSFWFCNLIDPSKFAWFEFVTVDYFNLSFTKMEIVNTCDRMAKAITEGLGNESGSQSHLEETCHSFTFYGLGPRRSYYFWDFLKSEGEGGVASEDESGASSA